MGFAAVLETSSLEKLHVLLCKGAKWCLKCKLWVSWFQNNGFCQGLGDLQLGEVTFLLWKREAKGAFRKRRAVAAMGCRTRSCQGLCGLGDFHSLL